MVKIKFPKVLILAGLATLPVFWNQTSALALHDCDVITGNIANFKNAFFSGRKFDFSQVYSGDALEIAIKNLTSYCCKNILNQQKKADPRCKDTLNLTTNYPESPYLFDHLIDVGLRRLDGLKDKAYNLPVDPTGDARRNGKGDRKGIKGLAIDTDVSAPLTLLAEYKKYRTLHTGGAFQKVHLKLENMTAAEAGKLETFLENYNNPDPTIVSLADKYNNLCWIAWNIYEKKPTQKVSLGDDNVSKGRSYYKDCQAMVARRMSQENLYVKTILINVANKMLKDNLDATLNKQFVQDKLVALQQTLGRIKDLFMSITKQAPFCKKCQK